MEFTVCDALTTPLPHDYINYSKMSYVDSSGIQHPIYPTMKTKNPSNPLYNTKDDCTMIINKCESVVSGSSISTVVCSDTNYTPTFDSTSSTWKCCPCNNDDSVLLPACPTCIDGVTNACVTSTQWDGKSYIKQDTSTAVSYTHLTLPTTP